MTCSLLVLASQITGVILLILDVVLSTLHWLENKDSHHIFLQNNSKLCKLDIQVLLALFLQWQVMSAKEKVLIKSILKPDDGKERGKPEG